VPKKKAFHHAALNGSVPLTVRDEGASWLYHWHVDNRAELPPDESLPSKETLRLQVACSTFASWAEVGQWKHQLRTQCWECTHEVPRTWGTHASLPATIDGQQNWIDTTVTGAPWDFLPRDDRDRIVYVTDNDKVRLLRTPKLLPSDNLFEMKTLVRVLANGSVV